jgi:hypothetical protein
MTLNTLIKKYGTMYDGLFYNMKKNDDKKMENNKLTVKIPQICAKMRIVDEKTTNNTTHLSSKEEFL